MAQIDRGAARGTTMRGGLVDAAAASGGWSYYAGQPSRIEPTCWGLLALGPNLAGPREQAVAAGARQFLRSLQRADGFLVEPNTPGPNYGWNGLGLLALNAREDLDVVDRLANGLLSVKGVQIKGDGQQVVRQDGLLQAWSWTEGTFSWIEPTAYCVLALKVRQVGGPLVAQRIAEAEAVMFDRVCEPGGWNYGNSQVLMQDLRPYVPTTALALLALQDKRAHPAVVRSLDWLTAHALSEPSTMPLALAAVCLSVYGRPVTELLARLRQQQDRTRALGTAHLTAMAAYALDLPAHKAVAVRVA